MKPAEGLLSALAAGMMTASCVPAALKHHRFMTVFLTVAAGAAGLFALSLLLPDKLAQLTQDATCWFLVGAVAALALVATVRVLEGLLDS